MLFRGLVVNAQAGFAQRFDYFVGRVGHYRVIGGKPASNIRRGAGEFAFAHDENVQFGLFHRDLFYLNGFERKLITTVRIDCRARAEGQVELERAELVAGKTPRYGIGVIM